MNKALRLVLVEGSHEDASFLLEHLARGGYDVVCWERVDTPRGLKAALGGGVWDAVVSDWPMPAFGALGALGLVRENDPDLPFIVVSGATEEDAAVAVMRAGAHDFVPKGNLARLGPAIEREMDAAEVRRGKRRADAALEEGEGRLRSLVQDAPDVIAVLNANGTVRYASPATRMVLGHEPDELVGGHAFGHAHPDDLNRLARASVEVGGRPGIGPPVEFRFRHADGSWRHVEAVVNNLLEDPGVAGIVVGLRDVTERKRSEEEIREREERHRAVLERTGECITLVDPETKLVLEANVAFRELLGYAPEELSGTSLYDYVAEERQSVERTVRRVLEEGSQPVDERRYRRKDGTLLNVEVGASTIPYGGKKALCVVAHDITERKRTEESLRRSLDVLLALREAGQILGSTLESEKIVTRLLDIMRGVSGLVAAVINMQDESGRVRVWHASGLDELWSRARYAPEADAARHAVLATGVPRSFRLRRPQGPGSDPGAGYLAGLCLPLRMRDQSLIGVLEAYGPEDLAGEDDVAEILGSLAAQAASALENARLYGELAEREKRLGELVGKLINAQEEERRRVAYEVHDGLAQVAVAAHQHLQAFARRYPPTSERSTKDLDRIVGMVRRTVGEARRIIANLRPTTLDDFGLAAAVRLEVEELRGSGWQVDYEEELGEERLPVEVETALFRVAQEALTNARKHAPRASRVCLRLGRREDAIELEVRDWGEGFDPDALKGAAGPGERVGISGMRERIGMVGGRLEVNSRPGEGTSVEARVPLPGQGGVGRGTAVSADDAGPFVPGVRWGDDGLG